MSIDSALTTAFMVLVSVVGTAGNLLVIVAILHKRRLRTIPNYFIFDLAVCDLLTVSLAVPLRLVEVFHPGSIHCSIVIAVTILFDGLSRINIVFISLDRLIAVKFPFKYNVCITNRTVAVLVASGWTIMILFAILPIVGVGLAPEEVLRLNHGLCFFSTNLSTSYLLAFLIGFCLLPLIMATPINCFLLKASHRQLRVIHVQQVQVESSVNTYYRNVSAMLFSGRNQPASIPQCNRTFALKQKRVARMVIILVGFFVILVLPITIIDILGAFGVSNVPPAVTKVAVCMIYTNAMINVFVYAGFNGEFQRTFIEIFQAVNAKFRAVVSSL
ncbi:D(1A) dopamine receptor-like [Stylophora pistillata]|uniref:D(1A) dopamine receptor-like n=1 Tax=Stylophora pistillata TaxID=50429 RepID=UPI000C0506E2|nr:D(1A) dopamine receptor-like [Stylophora pistillata]